MISFILDFDLRKIYKYYGFIYKDRKNTNVVFLFTFRSTTDNDKKLISGNILNIRIRLHIDKRVILCAISYKSLVYKTIISSKHVQKNN